jgi:hypothetical protein
MPIDELIIGIPAWLQITVISVAKSRRLVEPT